MVQEAGHIKNTAVLIFLQIQCLYLMYSEVAWVLVYSGTQVQPQIILDTDYLPDYLSVSYDYALIQVLQVLKVFLLLPLPCKHSAATKGMTYFKVAVHVFL